ncbi:MAG: hypothetical protein Q7S00_06105 [bacterium]|nr:hypothetical protein [bacterium]
MGFPQTLSPEAQGGVATATGFATGFLWCTLAGENDLSTPKGWIRTTLCATGSAAQSASLFTLGTVLDKPETGWIVAGSWWAAQSSAGFTNWVGHRNGWEEEPVFQAFALPLNYAAAPLISTAGLLWASGIQATEGFNASVGTFGGMVLIDHDHCGEKAGTNLGATGHCFDQNDFVRNHEQGHQVQMAAMGDLGALSIDLGLILGGTFAELDPLYFMELLQDRRTFLEPWADDYSQTFRLFPSPIEKIKPKKTVKNKEAEKPKGRSPMEEIRKKITSEEPLTEGEEAFLLERLQTPVVVWDWYQKRYEEREKQRTDDIESVLRIIALSPESFSVEALQQLAPVVNELMKDKTLHRDLAFRGFASISPYLSVELQEEGLAILREVIEDPTTYPFLVKGAEEHYANALKSISRKRIARGQ